MRLGQRGYVTDVTTGTDQVRPRGDSPASTYMLRGAAVPSLLVSLGCVGVATATRGDTGLWGSLVGASLVYVFFGTSLLVLGATRTIEPVLALLVALGLYTAKVIALALAFVFLQGSGLLGEPLHRGALGLTVIVCTLAWTVFQIAAAVRHRQPLYDLGTQP